ncbi:hypothetical protein WICMUC_002857 [Wickerhamomyces mucosus]|uniref:Serine protease n=1 Tax=Wickerhamomyces mucosus TaxID=1378264 RepID=A0A9P8PNZ8_9ASCO|nr:hypothetical protein WICMUC_002857 [Wickerhamomyces mucosus]
MSGWLYIPITIHLESVSETYKTAALSGIYLFNLITKDYYILTISNIPQPQRYRFRFTCSSLITSSKVNWFPLTINDIVSITDYDSQLNSSNESQSLISFVNDLVNNNGFTLKPSEGGFADFAIVSLGITKRLRSTQPLIPIDQLTEFQFQTSKSVEIPSKVRIQCCPFSLTNVPMFANYQITGSINYKIKDSAFLSDIRYLDDIIGGIVMLEGKKSSIGLVCGNLSKKNGDGDVLLILSWNTILTLLDYKELKFNKIVKDFIQPQMALSTIPEKLFNLPKSKVFYNPINSVVRISVQSTQGQFWGSGVIISNEYIITNLHVLKLDHIKGLQITITNEPKIVFSLNDFEVYPSPLIGFDLCFLKLKTHNYDITPAILASRFSSESNIHITQPVKSIGHGLFYSKHPQDLTPFHSHGNINAVLSISIKELGPNSSINALLIVSASCWNGSSGGGIFNDENELIGIMTSNGKLSNGEILPNFTLSIPLPIIERCLYMIENGIEPIDVQDQIQGLWSLRNNHKNVVLDQFNTSRL